MILGADRVTSVKFSSIFLAFLLFWSNLGFCETDSYTFKVTKVSGNVTFRNPFSADWSEVVVGQKLKARSLVNILEGGGLSIKLTPKDSISTTEKIVVVSDPTILRLDDSLVRKIKTEEFVLNRFPDVPVAKGAEEITPVLKFKEAFEKMMAVIIKPPVKTGLKYLPPQQTSMAEIKNPIAVYNPLDGDFTKTARFPYEIEGSWSKVPGNDISYKVYMWNKNENRGQPIAIVVGENYQFMIKKPGSFYFQVIDTKENWSSQPHQFHVYDFEFHKNPVADRKDGDTYVPNRYIELEEPVNHDVYVGKQKLRFQWQTVVDSSTAGKYIISVENIQTNSVKRFSSKKNHREIRLGPGRYTWSVEFKMKKKRMISVISSEKNALEILPKGNLASYSKKIFDAIGGKYDSRINLVQP